MKFLVVVFIFFASISCLAQKRVVIHKPETTTIYPGLRRLFKPDLAKISLEANPGWKAIETLDSAKGIYQLLFTDPVDSSITNLSLIMEHYRRNSFDTAEWSSLKRSIRESYGNRGIGVYPLQDTIISQKTVSDTNIVARYELLAKQGESIDYVCAVIGGTSLILITIPIKPDEYAEKITYFKGIAYSVRLSQ
jgi:hypothetical protein